MVVVRLFCREEGRLEVSWVEIRFVRAERKEGGMAWVEEGSP